MTAFTDILLAISILQGFCGVAWLPFDYLRNNGEREYRTLAVLACLGSGLAMLDAPVALIYLKIHSAWWVYLPALVACNVVFVLSARRICSMKDGGKWKNSKVRVSLK